VNLLVLTGIHTAGKSTVGAALDAAGYRYDPEIADQLIQEGHDGSVDGDDAFQELVFEEEARRDRQREGSAVVETWHIGNLAHAYQQAGEDLQERQEEYLSAAAETDGLDVYGLHLGVPTDEIWERTDHFEDEDPAVEEFYARIDTDIRELYEDHGIPYATIDTAELEPDAVVEAASAYAADVL